MNKKQLIAAAAQQTGMTQRDMERAAEAMLSCMAEAMVRGERISLSGFGTFDVKERAERTGHLPKTGEKIRIPAAKIPVFKPSKFIKEKLNP